MSSVSVTADGFLVDAEELGTAFDLDPATVPESMRAGEITSRCETGLDEDAGRWRLTFYCGGRALRLTVDGSGTILARSTFATRPAIGRSEIPPAVVDRSAKRIKDGQ